ncbi:MAG: bifunctional folylpolyglutamate synthase/dihydrofolate synthase [Candidatus Saccharimonadales bacterium]
MSRFTELEAKIVATMPKPKKMGPAPNSIDLLSRMRALMSALDNPEKSLKIIHVAGTSGKTSTCYFLASLLTSAGFKTGLTISPDIDNVRERAIIDLLPLPENEWCDHMDEYFALVQGSNVQPSYFEFFMGFAFWIFKKLGIDYVVLETGLGGTWDGSNVALEPNKICAITDIGLDHTELLGDTLAKITKDKSGIIRAGNIAFVNRQAPEIIATLEARCEEVGANLRIIEDAPTTDFMERNFYFAEQIAKFVLARDYNAELNADQIAAAKQVKIPARAEKIEIAGKAIIMDGSHNPQKLHAFSSHLDRRYPSDSRILIATLGQNKLSELDECMAIFREISDHVIFTSFRHDSPETDYRESVFADTLMSGAQKVDFASAEYVASPEEALKKAQASPYSQIVITGSFYLLKAIRPNLYKF